MRDTADQLQIRYPIGEIDHAYGDIIPVNINPAFIVACSFQDPLVVIIALGVSPVRNVLLNCQLTFVPSVHKNLPA